MRQNKLMSNKEMADWMNKHTKELEKKYAGKWIAIRLPQGVVAAGNLKEVLANYKKKYPEEIPFTHLIPRKEETGYIL